VVTRLGVGWCVTSSGTVHVSWRRKMPGWAWSVWLQLGRHQAEKEKVKVGYSWAGTRLRKMKEKGKWRWAASPVRAEFLKRTVKQFFYVLAAAEDRFKNEFE
jgi:hypothetical protein